MSLTRADVEAILVKRVGPLLTSAGMDGTTVDGTNADLNDPIGGSILNLGYTVLNIVSIVDADVAQVQADEYSEILNVAELLTLENILGNLDDVDITVGPRTEKLSQIAAQVQRKIERIEARLKAKYGYGAASITASVITLDFAEHDDDE